MPRSFISLDLPSPAREKLADICFGLPGAIWVDPEQLHLTLRFLGQIDDSVFPRVREALAGVRFPAFYFSLKGLGCFPLRGDPEILWAGAAPSANAELQRLRGKIEGVLKRLGVEPDARKFFPHITLARLKGAGIERVAAYLADNALFSASELPALGFSLYSSRLHPEGAVHTLEGNYPLDGVLEGDF